MDLRAVASAVARHRTVTMLGVALAVALAFLAAFKVDLSSLSLERRQATVYESTARLFVTQQGFPWGRSTLRYRVSRGQPPVVEGEPDRFAQLAVLYAQLANSDSVAGALPKADRDAVTASVVTINPFSSEPLPMIDIAAKASSPRQARLLATTATNSFLTFIRRNQQRSNIPENDRVVLHVINPAQPGKVASAPSPALPALVLLTVLFVTIAGVFVSDNWRFGRGKRPAETAALPTADFARAEEAGAEAAVAISSAGMGGRPRVGRPEAAPSTLGHRKPSSEAQTAVQQSGNR